jgi:acyl-CoA thioester hydrolase
MGLYHVRMGEPFCVRIAVRNYELDQLGHVNQAVYHQYAEHARIELFRAAGVPIGDLVGVKAAPVLLSSTMHYRRELRGGDEVLVTATVSFGAGKTFRMDSTITKVDGTVSAEMECTVGLMDLTERKLLADPRDQLLAMASNPELISS